jgi:hypothetical protein
MKRLCAESNSLSLETERGGVEGWTGLGWDGNSEIKLLSVGCEAEMNFAEVTLKLQKPPGWQEITAYRCLPVLCSATPYVFYQPAQSDC